MKSIIAAGAFFALAGSAHAGSVYTNVENNVAWQDGDYAAAITEVHVGYEFDNGIYVQTGPAFVDVDGEDLTTEYSGKVGIASDVSESLELYGEFAFVTDGQDFVDDMNVATQVGLTYKF